MPLHIDEEQTTNGRNGHELNNCLCLEDEYAGTSSSVDTSCTLEFSDESSCKINDKKETSKKTKRSSKGRRSTRCRSPTQVIFLLYSVLLTHLYLRTSFCYSLSYFLSDQLKLTHLKRTMLTFTPAAQFLTDR